MSGETERDVSGWTVDTLRVAVSRDLEQTDRVLTLAVASLDSRLGEQRAIYQQLLDGLRTQQQQQVDALYRMLQERYETQTKALDAAFLAQQTAMRTALEAADKAVQNALASAERAVAKAEVASDKRFESVNEFRAQLADQAATFISRTEAGVRITSISEKLDTETQRFTARFAELELRLTSRLDLNQGNNSGANEFRSERRLDVNTILQAFAFLAVVAAVLVAAFHK